MSTLLLGSEGSMGRRYQAILRSLGEPFVRIDSAILNPPGDAFENVDRFIIATPTPTHFDFISKCLRYGKPILCEKPISKNMDEVEAILEKDTQFQISMMMQYRRLTNDESEGESFYDYYAHGSDGLIWDCFQIISLANGQITLSDKSPIWKCKINGHTISKEDMDAAYVNEVKDWLGGNSLTHSDIRRLHKKVSNYEKAAYGS